MFCLAKTKLTKTTEEYKLLTTDSKEASQKALYETQLVKKISYDSKSNSKSIGLHTAHRDEF